MKCVFLFDKTGIMAKPWADAGHECWCFDGQHEPGIATIGNINMVGMWFNPKNIKEDVEKIINIVGANIDFIFGFPECTHLAVSGAAHFAKKLSCNPFIQDDAMELVFLTKLIGEKTGAIWALENPVSIISSKWRKPDYTFHPYEYGGYLPQNDEHPLYPDYIKPRDAYPKKTCIWSGNGFVMPPKKPVYVEPGYSAQHSKLGGKSLKTKNIRSATPRGFAIAVFEANNKRTTH